MCAAYLNAFRGEFQFHSFSASPNIIDYLTDYSYYDSSVRKPWIDRKKDYLDQLRHGRPESQLIVADSELHTAREILEGYRIKGSRSWWRFNLRREDHLWYFTQLLEVFDLLETNRIVDDLRKIVSELKQLPKDDRDTYVEGNAPEGSTREVILEVGTEGGSLSVIRTKHTGNLEILGSTRRNYDGRRAS